MFLGLLQPIHNVFLLISERFENLPRIKAFLKSPKFQQPFFPPFAKWGNGIDNPTTFKCRQVENQGAWEGVTASQDMSIYSVFRRSHCHLKKIDPNEKGTFNVILSSRLSALPHLPRCCTNECNYGLVICTRNLYEFL